jgi:hypothetical protein
MICTIRNRYAFIFWILISFSLGIWAICHQLSKFTDGRGYFAAGRAAFQKIGITRYGMSQKIKDKVNKAATSNGTSSSNLPPKTPITPSGSGRTKISIPKTILPKNYVSLTNSQFFVGIGISILAFGLCLIGPDYHSDQVPGRPLQKIQKSWWTSGARFGLIIFALIPMVIGLAVKQWPFNLMAIPWFTDYGVDKTINIHRWIGRFIWCLTTIHAWLWGVQLVKDKTPNGNSVLSVMPARYSFISAIFASKLSCFSWISG